MCGRSLSWSWIVEDERFAEISHAQRLNTSPAKRVFRGKFNEKLYPLNNKIHFASPLNCAIVAFYGYHS